MSKMKELGLDYQPADITLRCWLLVLHTAYAVRRLAETRLHAAGLTMAQAEVLTTLMLMGGVANPARIARFLFRESQSVVGMLTRMEAAGLVQCRRRFNGGKETRVEVLPKGRKLFHAASTVKANAAADVFSILPPQEIEELSSTLSKLRRHSVSLLEGKPAAGQAEAPVPLPE